MIWAEPGSVYITNLQDPVMREEYSRRLSAIGERYDVEMPPRERRQFDREMAEKYGGLPEWARWMLIAYDIMDQAEKIKEAHV